MSRICKFVECHILAEIIKILIIKDNSLVRTVNRFFYDNRSPMVHHNECFQFGRRSVTVIAVAQIIGIKSIGERLAINSEVRKQRVTTENFKPFVTRFIGVYRFNSLSPPYQIPTAACLSPQ